jgi:hypothetical protein
MHVLLEGSSESQAINKLIVYLMYYVCVCVCMELSSTGGPSRRGKEHLGASSICSIPQRSGPEHNRWSLVNV